MKKTIVLCVLALALLAVAAAAEEATKQTIPDVSLSKLIEHLALPTTWGNAYFNLRDMHKLIDAAAHLRPIDLGVFVTDQNVRVQLVAQSFHAGTVTFEAIRR
jgi:hypothetical protein